MSTAQNLAPHYEDGIRQIQPQLVGRSLTWLNERRNSAVKAFETLDFPERRMEGWRYSGVDKLLAQRFRPVLESQAPRPELDFEGLTLKDLEAHRLVFVNGRFSPEFSALQDVPAGVTVGSLHQAIRQFPDRVSPWLGRVAAADRHRFSAMNGTEMNDGLFIHVPRHHRLEWPIEVLYLTTELEFATMAQPRNLIVMAEGAAASLIERFASVGEILYFNNTVNECILEEGAELEHTRVQLESRSAYHLHSGFVEQGAESRYTSTIFALGGAWSRSELNLCFAAEGAQANLAGLFTVADRQLNDVHLNIDHAIPGCKSTSDFKGLLQGAGRGVFDGRIVVGRDAQQTEAHLNNANLLLSRSAEVDTKPQLEIYADNVKCSHGTTVGQLEEAPLFYLRSRGIDAQQARRLLCFGFAGEILDRCRHEPLRQTIEAELTDMLSSQHASPKSTEHG